MDKVDWQDKSVFVTGATGLLGGWLVKHLLEKKADVVCLMRDWVPQSMVVKDMINQVKIVRGDVCDQQLVERILGEYEVDTVFHLAAQTIVLVANRNPVSTFDSDIRGTWSLLEACRRSPTIHSIIISSSDKCYGIQERLPYTEDMPLRGCHPYEVSKSCVDLIAQSYWVTYKLPLAITRCGNIYGGGDLNWNRIVPGTIRSILRGQRPIIRSDGQYVRDYFYVEDAVHACVLLAEKLLGNVYLKGEAFNFSNEQPMTVLGIVEYILRIMDSELEPIINNEASSEIREQYLDSSKAHKILGWKPAYSIEDGLKKTIEWYKEEKMKNPRTPDLHCGKCGTLMLKSVPSKIVDGYSEENGEEKWELRQEYTCPTDGTKVYRVTNYLNSNTWFHYREMSDIPQTDW